MSLAWPPTGEPDSAAPAPGPGEPAAWAYTVSVRGLCEFSAKHGSLDRRFTPSATALEGLKGQGTVASRRGPDYETEVALETCCGPLRVRGRADGYDPRRRCAGRGEDAARPARRHPRQPPPAALGAAADLRRAVLPQPREVEESGAGARLLRRGLTQTETELRQVLRRGRAGTRALHATLRGLRGLGASKRPLHRQRA